MTNGNSLESAISPRRTPRAQLLLGISALAGALIVDASSAEAQSSGWVRGNPYDAIVGGSDLRGKPLHICMSDDPAWPGQHIGKRQAGWNYCSFGYAGEEADTGSYATLTPTWTRDLVGTPLGREADGTAQSVCHGWHEGGLHIGKQIGASRGCSIGYGTDEVWLSEYAVLQQHGSFSVWAQRISKPFPAGAIVGGQEKDGKLLYVCRARHAGGEHLGKTRSDWSYCSIGYGGDEKYVTDYDVFFPEFRSGTTESGRYPLLLAGGEKGQQFGICAGAYMDTWQVGKYMFADNLCHFGYDDRERTTSTFNTLRRH